MRDPTLQKILDNFQKEVFGRTSTQAQEAGICTTCGGKIEGFKSEKAEREYKISGMCQSCQDDVFNPFSECKKCKCEYYECVKEISSCVIGNDPEICEMLETSGN
jgi:hypothetical protein